MIKHFMPLKPTKRIGKELYAQYSACYSYFDTYHEIFFPFKNVKICIVSDQNRGSDEHINGARLFR